MSRRRRSKLFNEATAGSREEGIDVATWLMRPKATATREEVYALLRKYHVEVYMAELRRPSAWEVLGRMLFAAVLIPLRLVVRGAARRTVRRIEERNRARLAARRSPANEEPLVAPEEEDTDG